jgi:hypothetical protein
MDALLQYGVGRLTHRLLRRSSVAVTAAAGRNWVIHPAEQGFRRPALFLEGQLDQVEGVQEETTREIELGRVRGGPVEHAATHVYELNDAEIVAANVFSNGARLKLMAKSPLATALLSQEVSLGTAALDCSWVGCRYFGHWLTDDCTLHLAAREFAPTVSIERPSYPHEPGYSRMLGIDTRRVLRSRVQKLFVLDDKGQNASKRDRYERLRAALRVHGDSQPRQGVYLRRGTSGALRMLSNEDEIIGRLRQRGFTIADPEAMTAEALVRTCVGTPCIVSVEGSALAHGVLTVAAGGTLVALQPPWRFNNVFKDYADCLDLRYGFVVGKREGGSFRVDLGELERTLDLIVRP